ncbi:MAG TPA: sulfur carrier protein ThiS [Acetobacteraceae bacterium]|nr:sulfur carrier protein ThiS [Acetobacteraceae bacterium]
MPDDSPHARIGLTLNGESRALPAPLTVAGLIGQLGLPLAKIAVERNGEIVPRSQHATTWLADGDRLEIVHFIGGG